MIGNSLLKYFYLSLQKQTKYYDSKRILQQKN